LAAKVVLVIEDDPLQMMLIRDALTERGFRIESASDADEGIAKAKNLRPYFVLVDFHLSKRASAKDGIDVLNALRADPDTARLTVLAITGSAQGAENARIQRAGFDGVIIKPYNEGVFESAMRDAKARQRKQRDQQNPVDR
jgi:CheY-like chemotaxis protein